MRFGSPVFAPYRGLICDLDGVVYRGGFAVPGALDALNRLLGRGRSIVFATNNASREPTEVDSHLRQLGLAEGPWSVTTSAEAAANHLAGLVPPGSRVLAVGGPGVAAALDEVGLVPVRVGEPATASVVAIVQGLGRDVTWRELTEVGHLARAGVPWLATNLDLALPTERGPAPGNGALVRLVESVAGTSPRSLGKPEPGFFVAARRRLGTSAQRTLVCGDRLDTDVAGARAAGLDSLLVLSGVTELHALAFAPSDQRPTYVATDVTGLLSPAVRLSPAPTGTVRMSDGVPEIVATGDRQRCLESVVTTAWAVVDAGGELDRRPAPWRGLERRLGLG